MSLRFNTRITIEVDNIQEDSSVVSDSYVIFEVYNNSTGTWSIVPAINIQYFNGTNFVHPAEAYINIDFNYNNTPNLKSLYLDFKIIPSAGVDSMMVRLTLKSNLGSTVNNLVEYTVFDNFANNLIRDVEEIQRVLGLPLTTKSFPTTQVRADNDLELTVESWAVDSSTSLIDIKMSKDIGVKYLSQLLQLDGNIIQDINYPTGSFPVSNYIKREDAIDNQVDVGSYTFEVVENHTLALISSPATVTFNSTLDITSLLYVTTTLSNCIFRVVLLGTNYPDKLYLVLGDSSIVEGVVISTSLTGSKEYQFTSLDISTLLNNSNHNVYIGDSIILGKHLSVRPSTDGTTLVSGKSIYYQQVLPTQYKEPVATVN